MGDAAVTGVALRCLAIVVLTLVAGAALAQDWITNSYDDGSYFTGALSPIDGPGFTLVCGERSPQGLSGAQTGNNEPDITGPNAFRLYLSETDIGPPGPQLAGRQDVLVVIATTGYRLPPIIWNELFNTWETNVPARDPVFAAIAAQTSFELRSDRGSHIVPARGFSDALGQLTTYCQSMFAAIGLPWAGSVPAPGRTAMRQAAHAHILAGCGGGVLDQSDAFLFGEIDGDGIEDVVLDWRGVRCAGPTPYPYCGASNCSVDVFLSSLFPRKQRPEGLLALGARLFPLTNGNMGVGMYGGLSACRKVFGTNDCEFQYYWNGSGLARLN